MTEELHKVDSAVQGLESPVKEAKDVKTRRQSSSLGPGVENIFLIAKKPKEEVKLELPLATQETGWKINTSPATVEDQAILDLHLTNPPVGRIDLHFPLGLVVTARNGKKGVTIRDALTAIHKAFKKRADDELDNPYLKGFEYDKTDEKTREYLTVHLQSQPALPSSGGGGGGGKKKKNKKDKEEE